VCTAKQLEGCRQGRDAPYYYRSAVTAVLVGSKAKNGSNMAACRYGICLSYLSCPASGWQKGGHK